MASLVHAKLSDQVGEIGEELVLLSVRHGEFNPEELSEKLLCLSTNATAVSKHLAGVPAKILTLPRELRDKIYKHLLKQSDPIKLYRYKNAQY